VKTIVKIFKVLFYLLIALVLLIVLADVAWIYIPQITAQGAVKDLQEIAHPTTAITLPSKAKVIALGEASHGNVEFQQLKLSVLQQLVESRNVRAFALEKDFGEGLAVNDYIHNLGEHASAEEAVMQLSFNIYHTQQMIELVQWMHDYNLSVPPEQQLSFYGFDLQNPKTGLRRLLKYCEENHLSSKVDLTSVQAYIDGNFSIADEQAKDALLSLSQIKQVLQEDPSQPEVPTMLNIIDCVQNLMVCHEEGGASNYIRYNNMRDNYMADNVLWITEQLKAQGDSNILIAGHNGHVAYTMDDAFVSYVPPHQSQTDRFV